jgi:hypothetical protein
MLKKMTAPKNVSWVVMERNRRGPDISEKHTLCILHVRGQGRLVFLVI